MKAIGYLHGSGALWVVKTKQKFCNNNNNKKKAKINVHKK